MSAIKMLLEQIYLDHVTFHRGQPNELCKFCEEEKEETINVGGKVLTLGEYDHVAADAADIIQDQEYRWGEGREVDND